MASHDGLTPSERLVTDLCRRSFLRLWTHPNPKGKKGKELCDCLIVCDRHVVIISVKDCTYRDTGDHTGWERWSKKAVEASVSQITGAERWLTSADQVERSDGRIVELPRHNVRKYHRIAVALGANGNVPLKWGDLGKGFVHICDERSLEAVFTTLDTITDFVEFLSDTEGLFNGYFRLILDGGGIEDLMALYIRNGNSYALAHTPDGPHPDMMILSDDLWRKLSSSEDFNEMKRDLESSYTWDRLIEHYTEDLLTDGMFDLHSKSPTQDQLALIAMAMQPRHHRAQLAEAFLEYLGNSKSAARVVVGYQETAFVFMVRSSADREFKMKELTLRCLIVRALCPGVKKVIGIGIDKPGASMVGYSSDLIYINYPEFPENMRIQALEMQKDLGYFKGVNWAQAR